MYFVIVENTTK